MRRVLAVLLAMASVAARAGEWGAPVDVPGMARVWVSPLLVAEVDGDDATAARVRELDPSAVLESSHARVRLWRVAQAAVRSDASLHLLPVFHDGPSTAAKKRVALGPVLVWPREGLDPAAFAKAIGAEVVPGRAWVVVPSTGGEAALALAAKLSARSDVAKVMPEWWYPAVRK